ncbi:IS91 family transposase [Muricomes intestini]|uniref:IS91 family transposase n=1 Tax=Muricomes intestini TaxID=1796634 RepID=UPI003FA5405E
MSILHTWGSNLEYHPHLHVLCLGGGLTQKNAWSEKKDGFFLPAGVVSSLFRGKFLSGLKNLRTENKLIFEGRSKKYKNHYVFQELLDICYKKKWVVFLKESFAGAGTIMEYLGRYTHRIAISNSRILSMNDTTVTEFGYTAHWRLP